MNLSFFSPSILAVNFDSELTTSSSPFSPPRPNRESWSPHCCVKLQLGKWWKSFPENTSGVLGSWLTPNHHVKVCALIWCVSFLHVSGVRCSSWSDVLWTARRRPVPRRLWCTPVPNGPQDTRGLWHTSLFTRGRAEWKGHFIYFSQRSQVKEVVAA